MPTSIDEKIVSMRFENKDFEKNIKQSMKSLENLEKSLELKGASNGIDDIRDQMKLLRADTEELSETLEHALSLPGIIARRVKEQIADTVINGFKKIKSTAMDLSDFGQYTSGLNKYEQKIANVKTIMNATGKSAQTVGKYLDDLMWYSDETSYSFSDMTSSIAQLTSAGGDIEKLIPMVEGIANATAFAGKGASEFSRAIYNLNQSYSQGALNLMDWKSLSLAGVDSKQLKTELMEAGVAAGTLKKQADGVYKTLKGTTVTAATFQTTLAEKWATQEVMESGFGKFAEFTEAVKAAVNDGTYDNASDAIRAMADSYPELGVQAFKAAQECKTFTEAIDAIKDAVSSGWMASFELIFGDISEATELWTGLNEILWDIFASGAEARNAALTMWHDDGGRTLAIEAITNAYLNLSSALSIVSDSFKSVFGFDGDDSVRKVADMLEGATKAFYAFTESLKLTDRAAEDLRTIFDGIFTAIRNVGGAIGGVSKGPLGVAIRIVNLLAGGAVHLLAGFVNLTKKTYALAEASGVFQSILNGLKMALLVVAGIIVKVAEYISRFMAAFQELPAFNGFVEDMGNMFTLLRGKAESGLVFVIDKLDKFFNLLETKGASAAGKFLEVLNNLMNNIHKISSGEMSITKLFNNILPSKAVEERVMSVGSTLTNTEKKLKIFGTAMTAVGGMLSTAWSNFIGFFQGLASSATTIDTFFADLISKLNLTKIAAAGFYGTFIFILMGIGSAIGGFGALMRGVAAIVKGAAGILEGGAKLLLSGAGLMKRADKFLKRMSFAATLESLSSVILNFAKSVALLTIVLTALSYVEMGPNLAQAEGIMIGLAAGVAAMAGAFAFMAKAMPGGVEGVTKPIAAIVGILSMVGLLFSFASAIKMLAEVVGTDMEKGRAAVAISFGLITLFMIEMGALAKYMSVKAPEFKGQLLSAIAIAGAVKSLAGAIASIAKALGGFTNQSQVDGLTASIAGMMLMIVAICGLLATLSVTKVSPGKVIAILSVAVLIASLASAFGQITNINITGDAVNAVATMAISIIAITASLTLAAAYIKPIRLAIATIGRAFEGVGAAILMLAIACVLLTNYCENIEQAKVAINTMLLSLGAIITAIIFFNGKFGGEFKVAAKSVLGITTAVLELAVACALMEKVNSLDGAIKTVVLLSVLFGYLLVLKDKLKELSLSGVPQTLLALGGALVAITLACALMNLVNWKALLKGGLALAALSGAVIAISKFIKPQALAGAAASILALGAAMISVAVAVDLLVPAVVILTAVAQDSDKIWTAAGVIIGLIAVLSLFAFAAKEFNGDLKALLAVAAIIAIMAASIYALAQLDTDKAFVAAFGLSMVIGVLAGSFKMLEDLSGDTLTSIGAGLTVASIGLSMLVTSLMGLTEIGDPASILSSMGGLATIIGSMAVAFKSLSEFGWEEMLAAGAAIGAIAFSCGQLAKGLASLAPAIKECDVSALVAMFAGIDGTLLTAAVAINICAGACETFKVGSLIFVAAVVVICYAVGLLLEAFSETAESMAKMYDSVANVFGSIEGACSAFANAITTAADRMGDALVGLENLRDFDYGSVTTDLDTIRSALDDVASSGESAASGAESAGSGLTTLSSNASASVAGIMEAANAVIYLKDAMNYLNDAGGKPSGAPSTSSPGGGGGSHSSSSNSYGGGGGPVRNSLYMDPRLSRGILETQVKKVNTDVKDVEAVTMKVDKAKENLSNSLNVPMGTDAKSEQKRNDQVKEYKKQRESNVSAMVEADERAYKEYQKETNAKAKDYASNSRKENDYNPEATGFFNKLTRAWKESAEKNFEKRIDNTFKGTNEHIETYGETAAKVAGEEAVNTMSKFFGEGMLNADGKVDIGGWIGKMGEKIGLTGENGLLSLMDPNSVMMQGVDDVIEQVEETMQDKLDNMDLDAGGGGGGGSGSGGGAAAKAEAAALINATDYAATLIQKLSEVYIDMDETLSGSEAFTIAKENVELLAEKIFELTASEEDLQKTGDERLEAIKKSFMSFRDSIAKSIGDVKDIFGELKDVELKSIDELISNAEKKLSHAEEIKDLYKEAYLMGAGGDFMTYAAQQGDGGESLLKAWVDGTEKQKKKLESLLSDVPTTVDDATDESLKYVALAVDETENGTNAMIQAYKKLELEELQAAKVRKQAAQESIETYQQIAASLDQSLGSCMDLFSDYQKYEDKTYDNILDNMKNQMNMFEEFNNSADLSADELLNNMQTQLDGVKSWGDAIENLKDRGVSNDLIKMLAEMGPEAGYEYAQAFLAMTDDELKSANSMYADSLTLKEDTAKRVSDSFEHEVGDSILDAMDKVTDRLEEWADGISELLEEGLDPSIVQKFIEQGPGSLDVVNAIINEDAIDEVNDRFADALSLKDELKQQVLEAFDELGQQSMVSMTTGMVEAETSEIVDAAGKAAQDTVLKSDVLPETGETMDQLIARSEAANAYVPIDASKQVITDTVTAANDTVQSEYQRLYDIGMYICEGLAEGIRAGESMVVNAIAEVIAAAIAEAKEDLEINSPSKVFREIGMYVDMGFSNGLDEYSMLVRDSATGITDEAYNAIADSIGRISELVTDNMDVNPVITPVIDLSDVNAKAGILNNMFGKYNLGGRATNLAGNISNGFARSEMARNLTDDNNVAVAGAQYQFVQNNYSPKALNRIEIYRQTRNQFARMRATVEGA